MLGINDTPFAAVGFEQIHRDGQRMAVLSARACYELYPDGRLILATGQKLALSDVYDGPPQSSPLMQASDLIPFKPAADVTVLATAYAPKGESMASWIAGVKIDDHAHVIRVNGPREWLASPANGGSGFALGPSQRCSMVPVDFRKAFGGRSIGDPNGDADQRNPVGPGLLDAKYTSVLHNYEAPVIDSETEAIGDPFARPDPQGFGPVAPSWFWRRRFAGTYDSSWRETRQPRLPQDFDYRFYQSAHPGLILAGYLRPGALVALARLTPGGGQLAFQVPDLEPYAHFQWIDGREVFARLNRDGLHIDVRGEPPWPVAITFRGWIEICPQFLRIDAGVTDASGAAHLPVSREHGPAEAVA